MIDTDVPNLRDTVTHYSELVLPEVDFRSPMQMESDFSMLGVGEKFMSGIVQGFTTINVSRREPANVAEGIANSLGTWLGITGMFFGGPATWTAKGSLLGLKATTMAASRGTRMATAISKSNFRSVPMWVGDKAVAGVRKAVQAGGGATSVAKFAATNPVATDAVKGAIRIGSAMGIVSWQEGVNAMLMGGAMGAFFGGSDRVIGNAIRGMRPQLKEALKITDDIAPAVQVERMRKAERVVSAVSAGIVSGLPSTLMGQPLEYQIYDYLFGAWLGAEPSFVMRTAHATIAKAQNRNAHIELFSKKTRPQNKEYQEMLKKVKNPKVREMIDEEIIAQADFHLGQKIGSSDKMHIIVALANSAAEAGKMSAEDAIKMNRQIFIDGMEGDMIKEGAAKYTAEAEADGMNPQQAENYALERIREEYYQWRTTKESPDFLKTWSEDVRVFTPEAKDYDLYKPVQIGDEFGLVSKLDKDGTVLQVLASDGVELVAGGKLRNAEEISAERAKSPNAHSIDRQDIVNKIVAWRYATDETGQPVNESLNVDERVWEYFPDLEANYKQPSFFLGEDGKYYPEVLIAGKSTQRMDVGFTTEKAAYRYAIDYLTTTSRERLLTRDPSDLHQEGILKRLVEEYSKPENEYRSRPVLEIVGDIVKDMDVKDTLKLKEDLFTNPFATYNKIVQSLIKTRDRTNERYELVRELAKAEKDQSPNRQNRIDKANEALKVHTDLYGTIKGWDGFLQDMNRQFPMKQGEQDYWSTKNPTVRDLRKWYKDMTLQKPIKSLVLVRASKNKKSKLEAMDRFPNGQRNIRVKAPSILQRTLHSINESYDVLHIDNMLNLDDNSVSRLNNVNGLSREQLNSHLDKLYRDGQLPHRYYIATGVKDKDTLRALPFMFGTPDNARGYLSRRMKELVKGDPKNELAAGIKDVLNGSPRDIMEFASNMRLWEKLNNDSVGLRKGKDGKNLYKYPVQFMNNQDGFIKTVAAMNKRLQIIDAEGALADPLFYKNADGSQKSEFKMLLIDRLYDVEGIEPFMARGSDRDYRADQHADGAVIVSQRTFDQMVADGGIDPQSGAIKGVTAFADSYGGFLGKYAMFRASDKADAFMEQHGVDFIHNDTTAKQQGDRKMYHLSVDKNGNGIVSDGKNTIIPETYSVPFEGVTINSGQSESLKSAMKRQGLPVQMMQAFSPHIVDRNIARETINEIMNESNQTQGKAFEFLAKLEKFDMLRTDDGLTKKVIADLRKEAQEIDIYDMSVKDIFQVLGGDPIYVEAGLYDSVIRQMHKSKEQILSDNMQDGIMDQGFQTLTDQYASQLDYLLEVRSATEQPLTPFEIKQRGLKGYADAVYRNFVVNKAMRPKMNYSLKSIGSTQDPWFLNEYGRVEEGEFMLGQAAKGMKVKVGETDMTLGEAWDQLATKRRQVDTKQETIDGLELARGRFKTDKGKTYKSITSQLESLRFEISLLKKDISNLDSAMDMLVTRVPIEHASGVRSLKFKGFTQESGVTSKLNPRDMANLGGMDLDIDSVFIFQNVGKKKYKAEDGTMRSMHDELKKPGAKDYWYNKETGEFMDPKTEAMQKYWNAVYDKTKRPQDMFDSNKLFEAGRGTAQANAALGLIVNGRRDLLAMADSMPKQTFRLDQLELSKSAKKTLLSVYGADTEVTLTLKPNADAIIDEIARAGINMSADAADLTSFVDKFSIKNRMHAAAYDITIKGKPKTKDLAKIQEAEKILRTNSPAMKILQQANQALSGKIGDNLNADAMMMITHLRKLNDDLMNHNSRSGNGSVGLTGLHGSYYKSIDMIVNTDLYYLPLEDLNMGNLDKFYTVATGFLNSKAKKKDLEGKDPETLQGSKLATSFRNLLEDITGLQGRVYRGAYDDFVKEYNQTLINYGKNKATIHELKAAHDALVEIVANDFNDLASAMVLYREAYALLKNGVTHQGKKLKFSEAEIMDKIKEIFTKADSIKREIYFHKTPGEYTPKSSVEMLELNWKQYRAGLHEGFRRFADFAGMSTMFKRTDKKDVFTNHLHQSEFMKHAAGKNINDFFLSFRSVSELPYAPGTRRLNDYNNRVEDEMKFMLENMVMDATRGEIDILFPYDYQDRPSPKRLDHRIAELKKRASFKSDNIEDSPLVNQNSPMYNTLLAQHTRALKAMGKYIAEGNEFKLSAEEQKLFYDLQQLFINHPQVANKFDLLFSGELSITRGEGAAIPFADGTMNDLRMFLAAARGHYHGDLLQKPKAESKIPRWMYWMVPDKYHRTFANIDLQMDPVILHTADNKTTQGLVFSSPAKRLVSWSNNIQLGIEIRNADMATEIAKTLDDIYTDLGKDFDTIWRYNALKRKVERGDPSSDDMKQYKKLQKQFNEITAEYYVHKGKNITKEDALAMLDSHLTEINKMTWKIVHDPDKPRYFYHGTERWIDANTTLARMSNSMMKGEIGEMWIPDTWTLNNMVLQQYVHKKIMADLKGDTPEIGSDRWIRLADNFIDKAGMNPALDVPNLPFDSYYPQRNHSAEALKKWRIEQKKRRRALSVEQTRERQYAAMRLYQDSGLLNSMDEDSILAELIGLNPAGVIPAKYNTGESQVAGHLRQRSRGEDQIPTWDPGIKSYFEYANSLIKNNYNKALSLVGSDQINKAEVRMRETIGGKATHYSDFLRMYLSDQVMTQTMIPKTWAENYAALNLKSSGYYYFTDRYYTELDKKIADKFGWEPLLRDNNLARPLRLSEIANLEAKYSLITLLSRPKTGIMNVYGGATILASDVGLSNAMKGWSLSEIQKVNPALKDWKTAMEFAEKHGAMESLIRYEVMESPGWNTNQGKKALSEMLKVIQKDPNASDLKLTEIANRYGLSDSFMNIAAFPMRYSERVLRTRSFFAHYIKAVNTLEVTGPSAAEHPWALRMAKNGVATSQFMYNNANRPAFSRSNVGKIFTRFKMWSIKSVQFRADAFNEMTADLHYDVSNSKAKKRFNDIMMVDMFMLALASLFPFSVFGNSIPEPLNWMNELVEWAFGDPEEKLRAFRGGQGLPQSLAPLSVALPASSRLLTSWIEPVMKDDWSQFAGYQVWTLFPFGLLARDVRNSMDRPGIAVDRLTGLPVNEVLFNPNSVAREPGRKNIADMLPDAENLPTANPLEQVRRLLPLDQILPMMDP